MKVEINSENKAKFFALYWGQLIGLDQEKGEKPCYVLAGNNIQYAETIELKPLSQISDEDAIEVGKIYEYAGKTTKWQNDHFKLVGKDYVEDTGSDSISLRIADLLRSRGYALPWMGLSVDEMVEAGWVKLI